MRGEGVIRMAHLRRESGHRSVQAVPRPPDVRSDGHATAPWRGLASLSFGTGSRMAFSNITLLDTTPEPAANSAISLRRAKAAGPARPNVSWLSGTNRHAPVPVRLYLSRSSESFPLAVAPVSRAAALTAEAANGRVTHMSATIGRPGSTASNQVGVLWLQPGCATVLQLWLPVLSQLCACASSSCKCKCTCK